MKKIFTLLAIAAVSTSAFAQHDLSVSLDNYTNNQVVVGAVGTSSFAENALDCAFTVTNNGQAIAAGDTVCIGLFIGANIYSLNLAANTVNYITDSIIPIGGTLQFNTAVVRLGF